jgi:protein TonB
MSSAALPEVFTADEVARAAGVPLETLATLIDAGELRPVPGTRFFAAADAIRVGPRLRALAAAQAQPPTDTLFAALPESTDFARPERRVPTIASSGAHAAAIGFLLWATAWPATHASNVAPSTPARLVFLVSPGAGGGGGGGTRNPRPATHVDRTGPRRTSLSVPAAQRHPVVRARDAEPSPRPMPAPATDPPRIERTQEPLPSKVLVAPVVDTAASSRDREGAIGAPPTDSESRGAGEGGGSGTGQGTGNGEGTGSGIGAGQGGGIGGGAYRPGSGIDPPRLLHEVKAAYTADARRRNISGDVGLEIVVTRAGGVGDVRVLQGLGAGLDEQAVAAVRQWRFAPARRLGQPVDVVVEVAVEFTLR